MALASITHFITEQAHRLYTEEGVQTAITQVIVPRAYQILAECKESAFQTAYVGALASVALLSTVRALKDRRLEPLLLLSIVPFCFAKERIRTIAGIFLIAVAGLLLVTRALDAWKDRNTSESTPIPSNKSPFPDFLVLSSACASLAFRAYALPQLQRGKSISLSPAIAFISNHARRILAECQASALHTAMVGVTLPISLCMTGWVLKDGHEHPIARLFVGSLSSLLCLSVARPYSRVVGAALIALLAIWALHDELRKETDTKPANFRDNLLMFLPPVSAAAALAIRIYLLKT